MQIFVNGDRHDIEPATLALALNAKIEANGKVFPVSDRAVDVVEALLRRLERSGASLRTISSPSRRASGASATRSSETTSTTGAQPLVSAASSAYANNGRPRSNVSDLGASPPKRMPRPAASTTAGRTGFRSPRARGGRAPARDGRGTRSTR